VAAEGRGGAGGERGRRSLRAGSPMSVIIVPIMEFQGFVSKSQLSEQGTVGGGMSPFRCRSPVRCRF